MIKLNYAVGILFPLLFFITPASAQLIINEWMAINVNVVEDSAGENDDWLEIYNGSNAPINLAGYYISDDINNPTLWQIPGSNPGLTTIPPNGFILLWADEDIDQGSNHLPFKLSASGDVITLLLPDGITTVDQITSGQQMSNVSFGRETDGSATFQFFVIPTPGFSNNTTAGPLTYNALFDLRILQSSDDAEEPVGQSTTVIDAQNLHIVNNSGENQTVGIRFQNIPLPAGTRVNNAYIQFRTALPGESIGPCDLTIHSEKNNNGATFDVSGQNISNRMLSTATVNWQPDEWTISNEVGPNQQTPDLSTLVQEVINLPGWSKGNALSFIFTGTGVRVPWSADNGNQNRVPRLFLEGEFNAPETLVQNLFINEVASQGTDYADEDGDCDDWIELYNAGTEDITIGGLFLTDNFDVLNKWQIASPVTIPAAGFLIIWTDEDLDQGGLHADFKLNKNGEQIALAQWLGNDFVILDSLTFGHIPLKKSYGRTIDGGGTWTTFGEITPNASNNNSLPLLSAPKIALPSGGYNGLQAISISHPNPTANIYYTTDGSEPDVNATLYTTPFVISSSTSLNVKAFAPGFFASQSAKSSYLINENLSIPSMFINMEPKYFFDDSIGIYVEGTNGDLGFCSTVPANWNQDWEVPVNLSMIKDVGPRAFGVNAGAEIGGDCSRLFDMKSLNISTRETKYGDGDINYPLFAGRDVEGYQRIRLDNGGQDYLRMGFRDGLLHTLLWNKVDVELQAFQPTALYLNGEFWGVHSIRESYEDEYFEALYGINKSDIDIIENPNLPWEETRKGDNIDYLEMFDFFENNNLSLPNNYSQAESLIDVNEFTNYWISQIYSANADWPANNITVWKEKKAGAKWRYAIMDMSSSSGYGLTDETESDYNSLETVTNETSLVFPNHKNSTLTFRKMLENEIFRNEYIQRTCSFIHLIYDTDRVNSYTDSIQMMFDPYMEKHIAKWGADNAAGGSYSNWQNGVDDFRQFFDDRPDFMRTFINDQFDLNGTYELLLNYNQNTGGVVNVNTNQMTTPYNYVGQYFKGVPVRVTAVAKPNYEFAYWLETNDTNPAIDFISNEDAILTPVFQVDVNLGVDTSLCQGSILLLDATIPGCDCDYLWSDGSSGSFLEAITDTTGTYSVTVTDAIGVSSVDEIMVSISPAPSAATSTFPVTCPEGADGSIDLQVTGGTGIYSYLWNTGSSQEDQFELMAGSYTVTVTDQNGCETIVDNISIDTPNAFVFLTEETQTTCSGGNDGSVDLIVTGGTEPYTFLWSNNSTSQNLTDVSAGNYNVIVTDDRGCEATTMAIVEEPDTFGATITTVLPMPGASDGIIQVDPFGGTAPYMINWFNGQTEPVLSSLPYGIYSVTISDARGCTYQDVINFFPVSYTEPEQLLAFDLLPNPASTSCQVKLQFSNNESFQLVIYNTTGKRLKQTIHEGQNLSLPLEVNDFSPGLYLIELQLSNGSAYRRLVVQ